MTIIAYSLVVLVLVASAVMAVLAKNLIQAAVVLGVGSIALSILFFMLDAPYAGGFELSVGAGLIGVLFIVVISLTQTLEERAHGP